MTPREIDRLLQCLRAEMEPFIKLLVKVEAAQPYSLTITTGNGFPDSVEFNIHWTPEGAKMRASILEFIELQKAALAKVLAAETSHVPQSLRTE